MSNDLAIKNANVTISINGLALSHYKKDRAWWETRFLRHIAGHNLTVTVKKNGKVTFSSEIEATEKISIISDKAEEVPPRYEEGNDKDLSHLVNFNAPEMVGNNFKFKDLPMTILTVSNACFYSKTISRREYTVQKNGADVFTRRIGVITGGDIVALTQTEIKFANSPKKNQTLTAEAGAVYEIIFDNDCANPPLDGGGDFNRYDSVIETTDRYTMVATESEASFGGGEPPEKEPPCASGEGGEGGTGGGG